MYCELGCKSQSWLKKGFGEALFGYLDDMSSGTNKIVLALFSNFFPINVGTCIHHVGLFDFFFNPTSLFAELSL